MNLRRAILVIPFAAALFACGDKGACVMPSGNEEICTIQTKSVCEQGKGHKFVGGECPAAGFPKKKDDYWDKK